MQSLPQSTLVSTSYGSKLTQYLTSESITFRDLLGQIVHSHTAQSIVEIHPQETTNNGLLGLVVSLHHLSDQL